MWKSDKKIFFYNMQTKSFNYNLPKNLIAQTPASPRDASRLLIYNRGEDKIMHDKFYNLIRYLQPEDILVFNDTKVFPARLILQKPAFRQVQGVYGGGRVEVFLLQNLSRGKWECLIGGKVETGLDLFAGNKNICKIIGKSKNENWIVQFSLNKKDFDIFLNKYGQTPIPPYIKTKDSKLIRQKYQTVYAHKKGSVAAPTAGLHFTKQLLKELNKFGVQLEFVTLHVGLGTFQPVKTEKIEEHKLHSEYAILNKSVCQRLNQAKQQKRRIIAVGTTSARVLEAASGLDGKLKPLSNWINLFIYPGYKFRFINGLLTNFHLPKSSLLMLVAGLIGRKKILQIYQTAIEKKYRFYSFGDAMLIV